MKTKFLVIINILMLMSVLFCVYKIIYAPQIRYVKSADLIYNYLGMKEAQLQQETEKEKIQANLDTLRADFQRSVNLYNSEYAKLSKEERMERERVLNMQQDNLTKYAQNTQQAIKQQDEKLTQGVLNQINSFVEEYSKKQGYEIVFGTTASGNILFAKDYLDITDEVLKAINEQYKPGIQVTE